MVFWASDHWKDSPEGQACIKNGRSSVDDARTLASLNLESSATRMAVQWPGRCPHPSASILPETDAFQLLAFAEDFPCPPAGIQRYVYHTVYAKQPATKGHGCNRGIGKRSTIAAEATFLLKTWCVRCAGPFRKLFVAWKLRVSIIHRLLQVLIA